jgi:hypothetical protein
MVPTDVKVAFIVEGDADKAFVEALVPRILGRGARAQVVRVGGKSGFRSAFANVAAFAEEGHPKVIVLVDADTCDAADIAEQRDRLVDTFRRHRVGDLAEVCLAVPALEAWLVAGYDDVPAELPPKRAPADALQVRGPADIGRLAAQLSIDKVRERSPSFDTFVRAVQRAATAMSGRAAERPASFGRRARRA